jgi:hypothetical protein
MEENKRRTRGKGYPPGVVQTRIVRYLLLSEDGTRTEPEIREYLSDMHGVRDRKTIINHLALLQSANVITKEARPGLENIWSASHDLALTDYVFREYDVNEFIEIYQAPFLKRYVTQHFISRLGAGVDHFEHGADWSQSEKKVSIPPDQKERGGYVMALSLFAAPISPTHFRNAFFPDKDSGDFILRNLLYVMGVRGRDGEPECDHPAEGILASTIANLMIDFNRYPTLQEDILRYFKHPCFRRIFSEVYDPYARTDITRCLSIFDSSCDVLNDDARLALFSAIAEDPADTIVDDDEWDILFSSMKDKYMPGPIGEA